MGSTLQSPVAWIVGRRGTESRKSIDKAILGMVSKSLGRNESKRIGDPETLYLRGRAPVGRAKAAWNVATESALYAFPDDHGSGLPHYPGLGSLGDSIFFTFQWHVSVFDRPAELSRPAKLAAISVAGRARIQGTATPTQ